MKKSSWKKHQIFEKWDDFENRLSSKGHSLWKMVSLGQKLKCLQTCEKRIYKHTRVVVWKNRWKKHQMFEKWDDFENRPSCKGYSLCMGYSLWKMVSLGQKWKWPKTCAKRLYKKTRVVLCKKPLEETPNIREMRRFWKSAILQRL